MNDGMGEYVATETIKLMLKKGIQVLNSNIIILGFTFKENCPDVRNTKVIDIYRELGEYGITPLVVDPQADAEEAKKLYGITFGTMEDVKDLDAVLIAVKHREFESLKPEDIAAFYRSDRPVKVFIDLKGLYNKADYAGEDWAYWRL